MADEFRVFVASPSDVNKERQSLTDVVSEINQTHGKPMDYRLELITWETHVVPEAGSRIQQIITDQIGSYDIFLGIMWRRFGTPTGVADSGTEEEFQNAYTAWRENPDIAIMFYFCKKPFMPNTLEEVEQMRKVVSFRTKLEGKVLAWDYSGPDEFPNLVRKHLCKRINRYLEQRRGQIGSRAEPNDDTISALRHIWNRMTPDLQRSFVIAYNENRGAGDAGVSSEDLFKAMLRLRPERLEPILQKIPKEALPEPVSGTIVEEPYITKERPWLSSCIKNSIHRLSEQLPEGRSLESTDMFADIAKNGTGVSVRRLREYRIGPEEINKILADKNIEVVGQ